MRSNLGLVSATTLLLSLSALPSSAGQGPQLVGSEFRVNLNTESQQRNPVAAWNPAGGALVVWENDHNGLRGRLFGADGTSQSDELELVANQVLPSIPGDGPVTTRRDPAVAFLPSGDFLLVWAEEVGHLESTIFFESLAIGTRDIFIARFNGAGQPASKRFRVSLNNAGLKSRPQIAVRPGGDALVVWMNQTRRGGPTADDGIFGRVVTATSRPTGPEFKVSTSPGTFAETPVLAVDPSGSFLVAWESRPAGTAYGTAIFARQFDATGAALASDFRVDSGVTGPQRRAAAASDGKGAFLVVWQGFFENVSQARIFGQRINGSGHLIGSQAQISKGYGTAQISPSVAAAPHQTFIVTWMDYEKWFPLGMAGVQVDGRGTALSNELWINDHQIGAKLRTSLASDGAGKYLAPYESFFDASNLGISARRFDTD
ncbi:MAG TPA: hypothetical protein VHR45_01355 [Thermoanaerobaculia bacterium]|nr:hypothetical protein [Thermoanaerobaculia bacterium]